MLFINSKHQEMMFENSIVTVLYCTDNTTYVYPNFSFHMSFMHTYVVTSMYVRVIKVWVQIVQFMKTLGMHMT